MTKGEPILQLQAVDVALQKQTFLQNVSLRLYPGQALGLIGPNGAGKSTLLRTIGGELKPVVGTIKIAGKGASHWNARQLACHLSALAQQSPLNFPFRVRDVVAMARLPHNSGRQWDQRIVANVMDNLDITHLAEAIYTQLSGGEKQRVQLARVIAQLYPLDGSQAKLLLLDEPCAGLDLKHQKRLAEIIAALKQTAVAIVVACHDLNWAAAFSDQLLALKAGRVQACGEVNRVLQPQTLEALFELPIHINRDAEANKTRVEWL